VSRVYWDTNLFIYLHEDHPEFGPLVRHIYEGMIARNDTLCTSVFTVGEVLTLPLRLKDEAATSAIRASMLSGEVELGRTASVHTGNCGKVRPDSGAFSVESGRCPAPGHRDRNEGQPVRHERSQAGQDDCSGKTTDDRPQWQTILEKIRKQQHDCGFSSCLSRSNTPALLESP
jgi:hypothetical protein